jgi:predicted DNA-binding transcriptional regulator AlpA
VQRTGLTHRPAQCYTLPAVIRGKPGTIRGEGSPMARAKKPEPELPSAPLDEGSLARIEATAATIVAAQLDPLALIDKQALARLLMIDPWTIDRWRKQHPDFPPPLWVTGTSPRWRRTEIETWLASRQRGGVSPDWNKRPVKRGSK